MVVNQISIFLHILFCSHSLSAWLWNVDWADDCDNKFSACRGTWCHTTSQDNFLPFLHSNHNFHSFCKKTRSSTSISDRCWYIIQYISWKQTKVIGKITRLYLSMSLAVIPNILLISFGVTTEIGCTIFGAGGHGAGGGGGASSSNLRGKRPTGWALLYLVMVFSLLPPLQCRLGSCTLKCTVWK